MSRIVVVCTLLVWAGVVALLLSVTPNGPGVSPDGVQYLDAASQAAEGHGLRAHFWNEGRQPLVHFPPMYPALLAAGQILGLDPLSAARVVSAVSLLLTLLSMAWVLSCRSPERFWPTVAVVAFLALSPDMLLVHAMALSEPPFVALMLAAVVALSRTMFDPGLGIVVLAGLLVGAATLTRYAGLAMTGVGVVVLLATRTPASLPWRARVARAAVFAAASSLPILAWAARNRIASGSVANRPLSFHPPASDDVRQAVAAVYHWLIPYGWSAGVSLLVVGLLVVCMCALFLDLRRDFHARRGIFSDRASAARDRSLVTILGLSCGGYFVFVVLAKSLGDAQIAFEPRMMLVALVPLALITALLFAGTSESRRSRFAGATVAVLALIASLDGVRSWITTVHSEGGIGYTSTEWIDSRLVREVAALPDSAEIYSNVPDGFFFLTGRLVNGLPREYNPQTLASEVRFPFEMDEICDRSMERAVYIAYRQHAEDQESFIPTLPEVASQLSTLTRATLEDGVLLSVPAGCRR